MNGVKEGHTEFSCYKRLFQWKLFRTNKFLNSSDASQI